MNNNIDLIDIFGNFDEFDVCEASYDIETVSTSSTYESLIDSLWALTTPGIELLVEVATDSIGSLEDSYVNKQPSSMISSSPTKMFSYNFKKANRWVELHQLYSLNYKLSSQTNWRTQHEGALAPILQVIPRVAMRYSVKRYQVLNNLVVQQANEPVHEQPEAVSEKSIAEELLENTSESEATRSGPHMATDPEVLLQFGPERYGDYDRHFYSVAKAQEQYSHSDTPANKLPVGKSLNCLEVTGNCLDSIICCGGQRVRNKNRPLNNFTKRVVKEMQEFDSDLVDLEDLKKIIKADNEGVVDTGSRKVSAVNGIYPRIVAMMVRYLRIRFFRNVRSDATTQAIASWFLRNYKSFGIRTIDADYLLELTVEYYYEIISHSSILANEIKGLQSIRLAKFSQSNPGIIKRAMMWAFRLSWD